ncbi:MAG TPA: hypothetical protein VH300_11865 [Thermoleophilaceae bacterium]|jgi:hypothetical protein|nr:hypothetical protein [Thermoleophilaceae bacterium]
MARRIDMAALVAGILVAVFGVVLLLDAAGTLHLHLVALAPIAALIGGATLLATGLTRRD